MSLLLPLLGALRAAVRTHRNLALENLALRQQLALLRRRSKRPRFGSLDRAFWVWLSRRWAGWREALHIVRPETVIRWHRKGFRSFWTWKSRRGRTGRPRIGSELAELVRTMALANPLGRAAHPRRVAQARARRLAADCCPSHAASPEVAFADLANFPSEPRRRSRLGRLLRGADGDLPCALRVRPPAASTPPNRAFHCDRFPNRRLDRATDHRGVPR